MSQLLQVGDIVICHGWTPIEGKLGFIEEIIVDPQGSKKWKAEGQYSVYGLEEVEFSSGKSYYYGDFVGEKLIPTGESVTKEQLERLKWAKPDNKGMQNDMDIVIRNLGREKGRNTKPAVHTIEGKIQ